MVLWVTSGISLSEHLFYFRLSSSAVQVILLYELQFAGSVSVESYFYQVRKMTIFSNSNCGLYQYIYTDKKYKNKYRKKELMRKLTSNVYPDLETGR